MTRIEQNTIAFLCLFLFASYAKANFNTNLTHNAILQSPNSLLVDRTKSDTMKPSRHGIYIEPWLFGRIGTFGYTYDFYTRKKLCLSAALGLGMKFKFSNPNTAFYIPFGVETEYELTKSWFLGIGVHNRIYLNYWANFHESGKNCTGLGDCPPDKDLFELLPYAGMSFKYRKWSIEPRVYLSLFAWYDTVYPLPTLRLKLKL